jgi:pimeloyl-ACP methyl ester carboxylesterase
MKTIYCISGLGADERAFSRLKVEGYHLICLPWLTPLPKESITAYATRMSKGITAENPILMGLSFGGMMSIEISKLIPVETVILISSIKSTNEMPRWMKLAGSLKLNRLFPMRSFRLTEPIQNRFIGITLPDEIELVRSYRKNAPQVYMDWAINEVLNWRNDFQPATIYHVHGDADRIFPVANLSPNYIIKGGGHFMIMNKFKEVNAALQQILLTEG